MTTTITWTGAGLDDVEFDLVDNGIDGFDLQCDNALASSLSFWAIRRSNSRAVEAAALGPLPVITGEFAFYIDFQEEVAESVAEQVVVYHDPQDEDPPYYPAFTVTQQIDPNVWLIEPNYLFNSGGGSVTVPANIYSNNQEAVAGFQFQPQ